MRINRVQAFLCDAGWRLRASRHNQGGISHKAIAGVD
jgi:hypothetical protein